MDYILEARGVSYRYGRKDGEGYALKDVSIGIRPGVRTVILGANGAGKSTLFYHFNGVFKPAEGEVRYRDIPLSYDRNVLYQLRDDISVVVQNPDEQIFSSTVEEDVAFGPMNRNLRPDIVERRIVSCLSMVGMEGYRSRPTTQLSFGQKKRVAIAGALATDPKVLILDEPTAGLDPQMSQEVMEMVDQLVNSGTTVIVSTHDVDLAYAWADEVHVLIHGKLMFSGRPEDFFSDPAKVSLAGLAQPHTFSVNSAVEDIRGNPENPYPRTNSQILAKMAHPGSPVGMITLNRVTAEEGVDFSGLRPNSGIYGFRTRRLFKEAGVTTDYMFNAVEMCMLEAVSGRDSTLYADEEIVDMIIRRIGTLSDFGMDPVLEVRRWTTSS